MVLCIQQVGCARVLEGDFLLVKKMQQA
jgi:hypothetical protein